MYGEKSVLPNGVRVLSFTMPHVRSVSINITFTVGSRHEPANQAGIAHFIEHMFFKGTPTRRHPERIIEQIQGIGGLLNAYTSVEQTGLTAKVPSTHFALTFDVLGDILRNPLFDPEALEIERGVILEEIRAGRSEATELAGQLLNRVLWEEQAIGRPVVGDEATIGRIDRAALLGFFRAHYTAANLVISAAGDVRHADVARRAEALFGDLPAGEPVRPWPASTRRTVPRIGLIRWPGRQATLMLATPGLSYHDERRDIQRSLDVLLGSGMSSRLFREIRARRGMAYAIGSYFTQYVDVGTGVIYAAVDAARVDVVVRAVAGELRQFRDAPAPADELGRAKEFRKGRVLMGLEDSQSVTAWLSSHESLYKLVPTPEEVIARIDAATPADVQALACDLFSPERYCLAIVSPDGDEAHFRALLGEIAGCAKPDVPSR